MITNERRTKELSELYQSLSHSKWDCKYHIVFVSAQSDNVLFEQSRNVLLTPFKLRRWTKDNY
jgi:REP element-mobilizing transposase RayT